MMRVKALDEAAIVRIGFINHGAQCPGLAWRAAAGYGRRAILCALAGLLATVGPAPHVAAQRIGGGQPGPAYTSALALFYEGDFGHATEAFRAAAQLSLRIVDVPWVDSLCYHTMTGECYLRLGELGHALDQYNTALTIFLRYPDWMSNGRVEFPAEVTPSQSRIRSTITWGSRTTLLGDFSSGVPVMFGNPNSAEVLQRGGVFVPPEMHMVNAAEIVRCTALALLRRRELLGPLCQHDPLSGRVLEALEGRVGAPNHWSWGWIELLRGMALTGMDRNDEAAAALGRGVLIGGGFDHPVTGLALLALGRLAQQSQQYPAAGEYFLQASLAGAEFEQVSLVEESLAAATAMYIMAGGRDVYPHIAPAIAWAQRSRSTHVLASLLADAAESAYVAGNPQAAGAAVAQVPRGRGRRSRISVQLAARLQYLAALVSFQQGNEAAATESLAQAITLQQRASPWLYQIVAASDLFGQRTDALTTKTTSSLFEALLREPTADDWLANPLDTLAVMSTPHIEPYEQWLELVLDRRQPDEVIEISERIRRHRFFASLPLGGRMLALRWVLEAPSALVSQEALARRQDLLTRYPHYDKLSKEARQVLVHLSRIPLVPEELDSVRQQADLLARLGNLSAQQESLIGEIALRREPAPMVIPPLMNKDEIQQQLAPNQLVLAFTPTSRGWQALMLSHERYAMWEVRSQRLRRDVSELLRAIGMHDANGSLSDKQLQDERWKGLGATIADRIIDKQQAGFWNRFDELIIVPDGFLWYLPFEALQVQDENERRSLISRIRIRYAPLLSLALGDGREKVRNPQTAVVAGRLFPRDDPAASLEQLEQMQTVVDGLIPLPERLPGPTGLYRCVWDRLLVLDDIREARQGPFDWSPGRIDAGRPQSNLTRWLALPWGGPREMILPGFHTAAESDWGKADDGEEVFLALTALLAGGTDTVIMARWRTGGQTSYDLIREYLQEAPHTSPSEAWRRSIQVVQEIEVDRTSEPRVSQSPADTPIKAEHPFFWAGYILCDRGSKVTPGQAARP